MQCPFFIKGLCFLGEKCRLLHEKPDNDLKSDIFLSNEINRKTSDEDDIVCIDYTSEMKYNSTADIPVKLNHVIAENKMLKNLTNTTLSSHCHTMARIKHLNCPCYLFRRMKVHSANKCLT